MAVTERKKELLSITGLAAILLLIATVICRQYLFGAYTYIFRDAGSDTFNQYWPVIETFVRKVHNGDLHFWIFSMGLGGSVTGILDYVSDPFTLLLLLFPDGTLAYGLVWIAVLKEIAAGLFFYLYARETGLKRAPAYIGSIAWTFSGFMVLWGQHYFLATVIPYFSLIMLGEAVFRKRHDGKLLILSLWLAAVSFIYTAVWLVLGLIVAVLLRYILEEKKTWRGFFRYLVGFLWRGLIAAGLSAFRWLPSMLALKGSAEYSSRIAGKGLLWSKTDYLDLLLRMFSDNSLGNSAVNVLGFNYYEQIMLATSILSVVFLFHNLIVRRGKERWLCIATATLTAFLLLTRLGALFMNVGKDVTLRWSYLIIFLLTLNLTFAMQDILDQKTERLAAVVGEFLFGGLLLFGTFHVFWKKFAVWMTGEDIVLSQTVYRSCFLFLLLYFGLILFLIFFKGEGGMRKTALIVLIALLCIETVTLNDPTLNCSRVAVPKAGAYTMDYFSPGSRVAIEEIKARDQGLFRMERTAISGGNDPLMMNYYGTFSYGAHGKEIGEFFERNGLNDPNGDFTSRIAGNSVLESLLGVKYMISTETLSEDGYEEIARISVYNDAVDMQEELYINQNQFAFPLVYTTDGETAGDIDEMLGGNYGKADLRAVYEKVIGMEIDTFRDSEITGTVYRQTEGFLLTSIPYDKGWSVFVDGKRSRCENKNHGFLGLPLSAGIHEIRFVYRPPGMLTGALLSAMTAGLSILIYCWRNARKRENA